MKSLFQILSSGRQRVAAAFAVVATIAGTASAQAPTTYQEMLGSDPTEHVATFGTAVGTLIGILALLFIGCLVAGLVFSKMRKYGGKSV